MINIKKLTKVGIAGWGVYLPRQKITIVDLAAQRGQNSQAITQSLGVKEKTVCEDDEDTLTMAYEASIKALKMAKIKPAAIGAVFVGSESHPYAVKPTGTILGSILNIGNDYFCADLQFACKAATAGIQIIAGFLEAGLINYGLVVGSDKAQAKPGDVLEYTAASGAAGLILTNKPEEIKVKLNYTYSLSSDTPDFWRRPFCPFPSHAGRFTGEPGYFYHTKTCLQNFLLAIKKKPIDFQAIVLHMPNAKFPQKLCSQTGFTKKQLDLGLTVKEIGNPYSASSLIGLCRILNNAKEKDNIIMVSYGSGAGSDAFWWQTTKKINEN